MTARAFVFTAAVLVAAATCVSAQARCRRPESCVRVSQCDWLSQLLRQEPRPPGTIEMLRSLVCGREWRYPLVCCDRPSNQWEATKPTPTPPKQQATPKPPVNNGGLENHPSWKLLPREECGYVDADKILFGNETGLGEYPWMVLLQYASPGSSDRQFLCAGSLISKRYVLTASHCVNSEILGDSKIVGARLGEYDVRMDPDCKQQIDGTNWCADPVIDVGVEETIPHPRYNPRRGSDMTNDIALVRLDRDAPIESFYIKPICLPISAANRQSFVGEKLVVAGWGKTEYKVGSPVKLKAFVPVMDSESCKALFIKWRRPITENQLCAGGGNDRKDSCNGDSGGPLMRSEDNLYVLIGVVSYGPRECGTPGYPGVYTLVSSYLNWILDTMRP